MRLLRGIGRLLGQRMMGLRAVTPARTRPAIAPAHTHALAPVRERLRSEAGETISEVLVGVLIVGLASVLFAAMVSVATSTSLKGVDRTDMTYRQLSAVDAGSAGQGTASVTLSNAADVASDVPGPTVMFVVNTQSSNPDNDAEATYAFTHYQLPLVEQAREGERA